MKVKNILCAVLMISSVTSVIVVANLNYDIERIKEISLNRLFDAQDNAGDTPLHCGVFNYYKDGASNKAKDTLIALINGWPNPFIENHRNKTPRQEAELLLQLPQYKETNDIVEAIELLKSYEELYCEAVVEFLGREDLRK